MPKKKGKIIITLIIILLLIIMIIIGYLYLTTDMFKSNSTLFAKYIGETMQNMQTVLKDEKGEEYNRLLENNKYETNSKITAKYTQNMGTTDENTANIINNLKINVNGQIDIKNNLDYKKIILSKNEEDLINLEYLKSNNKYGIKFVDLFKQYLAVENSNLKEFAPEIGIKKEIPDSIEYIDFSKIITFTDEEIKNINNTYVNAITKDFKENQFTKIKNSTITIKNQSVQTNTYTLKITKEQINNIYISILEQLKKDEIILSKIDSLNDLYKINKGEDNQQEDVTLRDEIIKKIDGIIIDIKNKNIGEDEAKITVYENMKKAVRLAIETKEYKINIDTQENTSGTYIKVLYEIFGNKEDTTEITIDKKENELNIKYEKIKDTKTNTANITQTREIVDNKKETTTSFEYTNETDKIEMTIKDNTQIVNNFNETQEFSNDNVVILNKLNDEQLKNTLNTINDKTIEKQQFLAQIINYEEILNILKRFELISQKVTISSLNTLTKTEVTKFNAEFDIYKGEELTVDSVDNLLKVAKNNLGNIEVISENVLKLNIEQNVKNEELANKISEIIKSEKNKGKKYSIKMEYDQETGIIKAVIVEIMKKTN